MVSQAVVREPAASLNPVEVTQVAWTPQPSLPIAEWIRHGARFGQLGRACGWWIGDWINFGNVQYGQKYSRAARITGHDVQTLMNMAYVASRFPTSRRREKLSWSHHAELAALPQPEQDGWLDRIEHEGLTVKDLRDLRRKPSAGHRAGADQDAATGPELVPDAHSLSCPQCGHVFHT